MTKNKTDKKIEENKICKELREALKAKPFFDVGGGCGVDMSLGESNCMSKSGVWFKFCPFCGKEIVSRQVQGKTGVHWEWNEVTNTEVQKAREEAYKEGYEAKMQVAPNYRMFELVSKMILLHGDTFMEWWEKKGSKDFKEYLQSLDKGDKED